MNKILDKSIILLGCMTSLLFIPFSPLYLAALLCAIVVGFLSEVRFIPPLVCTIAIGLYLAAALVFFECVFFVPLVAYDYLRKPSWFYRAIWALPLFAGVRFGDYLAIILVAGICLVAVLLARRTFLMDKELADYRILRDELREESLALERRNRDLRERQDMDIHVATLDERGRIAREIHDNVGHLLTRAVLQVEALQVVHTNEPAIQSEFKEVGTTIHEALDTVRASVHNLHDDAFDLQSQLLKTIEGSTELSIKLNYVAESIPASVGYCYIALTREAISNTLKHSTARTMEISVLEQPAFYRLTLCETDASSKDMTSHRAKGAQASAAPLPPFEDPTRASEPKQGIGLRSMEDRVRSLGGILRIDASKGFKIVASLPKVPPSETAAHD